MELIVYRKTLDMHKNGTQFTLQGFETADKMARRIEISLMAGGDTIDFPLEHIVAVMYVTTPSATEPSINSCTIKDNKIIYDVLPIVEEGITEMKLKIIETSVDGAKRVVATPRFVVEVTKSNVDDESAEQTTTFTALEDAVALAKGVYDSRLIRIELDSDCMFRAYYADGTMYESDVLKELFLKGDALLSQSYARGGTGIRAGEDTDNSKYYSNVSKSASEDSKRINEDTKEVLTEARKHGVYTAFSVDFESGEVEYISPSYKFNVNVETGDLEVEGETYSFEETIESIVNEWLLELGVDVNAMKTATDGNTTDIADLKAATDTNTEDIEELREIVDAHTSEIELHSQGISSYEGTVNNLCLTTEVHTEEIADLKTTTQAQANGLAYADARLSALETNFNNRGVKSGSISVMEVKETETIVRGTLDYKIMQDAINIIGAIDLVPETGLETDRIRYFYLEDNKDNSWRIRPFKDTKFPITIVTEYPDYDETRVHFISYDSTNGWSIPLPESSVFAYKLYFNLMFFVGFDSVG